MLGTREAEEIQGKLEAGYGEHPILDYGIIHGSYCVATEKHSGSMIRQAQPVLIKPVPLGLQLRETGATHITLPVSLPLPCRQGLLPAECTS